MQGSDVLSSCSAEIVLGREKGMPMTSVKSPAVQDFNSRAMMDQKSLSPLFPTSRGGGHWGGWGANGYK